MEENAKLDLLSSRPADKLKNIKIMPIKIKVTRKTLIALALLIIVGVGAYYLKANFIAGFVNGKPIFRNEVAKELERRNGQAVLEGLINKTLIEQEAKEKGIVVTPQEIDTDLAEIEKNMKAQNTDMATQLESQHLTVDEFKALLMTNKLLEKLIADKAGVTEEEITKYIEENKDVFPPEAKEEDKRAQVKEFLQNQKVETESQKLFAELRAKAKLNLWVSY